MPAEMDFEITSPYDPSVFEGPSMREKKEIATAKVVSLKMEKIESKN